MKYSIDILDDYVKKKLVVKKDHPTFPISIYTYSRKCQYEKLWDSITKDCRGLILDKDGNVIAKPFPKFFNLEEHELSEIPNEPFEVFEKLDGSLGIIYHYNDEWHIATKGSFNSDLSIIAKGLLKKYNTQFGLIPGWSYLVEIIHPKSRVVVDYNGEEKLVVLGCYNIETNKEGSIEHMVSEGWEIVKRYDGISDFKMLKETITDDKEGYVVRFKNGFRVKIKGEEYIRLHRILTNFSTTDIWDILRNGGDMDEFLERVPDEFDRWVHSTIRELKNSFYAIEEKTGKLNDYFRYVHTEPTKKEFAEYVMKQEPKLRPLMFAMWDKIPYDDIIWKIIKPKYAKPTNNKKEIYDTQTN